jgi:23S rRNA pseudouridine1911/1915/1917 synthase
LIESGKVSVNEKALTEPATQVKAGDSIEIRMSAPRVRPNEPALSSERIVYLDRDLVVVDKPSGINSVAYADERDSLEELLRMLLRKRSEAGSQSPLGIVHRLDRETSGLIVYARTLPAKRHLKQQFRFRRVRRRYVAIVNGRMRSQTIASHLIRDRGDGLRGSTPNPKLGKLAITHVSVRKATPHASLVTCRLETGRTHQIRIHLSEAGHPLLGERVYVRRLHAPPASEPLLVAPRLMLHAELLGFEHPRTGRQLDFGSTLPPDLQSLMRGLGLG